MHSDNIDYTIESSCQLECIAVTHDSLSVCSCYACMTMLVWLGPLQINAYVTPYPHIGSETYAFNMLCLI